MEIEPFAFALYLHNQPGVLNRVALVFSRRGWNIDNVSISPAEDGEYARCNLVAQGKRSGISNVAAQLNKLIDVVSARHEELDHRILSREVVLIKVAIDPNGMEDLRESAQELDCQLIDISGNSAIFQFVGTAAHTRFIRETIGERHRVLDVIRSGAITMPRTEDHPGDVSQLGPEDLLTAEGKSIDR